MPSTTARSARHAIELMTAWLDAPDGPPDLFIACLRRHIEEQPDSDRLGAALELIMGMTQLGGGLLVLLEEASGITPQEALQEFGQFYARD